MTPDAKRTNRMRKLPTIEPSIPVMNEGPISAGKVVGVGPFGAGTDGPDVPGASNDIAAIASWSSIVKDTNRRAISLDNNIASSWQTSVENAS